MPRRPRFRYMSFRLPPLTKKARRVIVLLVIAAFIFSIVAKATSYLREISSDMAVSSAVDTITIEVNKVVNAKMSEGSFDYDYFVTLEKDEEGNVTAIQTNMGRVNLLASEILGGVVGDAKNREIDILVPLGNLTGMNLLLGRGPKVPIRILTLTTSYCDFSNELVSAGINQTKHQIILRVVVNTNVLVPWQTVSSQVTCDVLIAETIIVGKVPDTYLNVE